jgi:hypothetical protein
VKPDPHHTPTRNNLDETPRAVDYRSTEREKDARVITVTVRTKRNETKPKSFRKLNFRTFGGGVTRRIRKTRLVRARHGWWTIGRRFGEIVR